MRTPWIRMALWLAACGPALVLGACAAPQQAAVEPAPPEAAPSPSPQRLDEADAARRRGDYQTALALFRGILADNPTLAVAYVGIGEIYIAQKDFARAEPVLARAVLLEPRNFAAQYGHGLALQMLDRFLDAVRAYHRALTIEPESVEANLHLAQTYVQLGRLDSARVFAEKAVQLDPGNGPARADLGGIYQGLERYDQAVAQYEVAVELMEPTPPLLLNLINAQIKENRYVDAKNACEYLIKITPSAGAYERLGYCDFRLGDYDRSIEAYRHAVELDPDHWPSLNGIGCNALNKWLLSNRSDTAAGREARESLRRSLQVNPDQQKVIALLSQYGI